MTDIDQMIKDAETRLAGAILSNSPVVAQQWLALLRSLRYDRDHR